MGVAKFDERADILGRFGTRDIFRLPLPTATGFFDIAGFYGKEQMR